NQTATFTYTTSPVTAQGLETMTMAAGAVTRQTDGDPLRAFSASFRYDALRMQVVSTAPAAGAVIQLPLSTLDVHLNEAVALDSVQPGDLRVNQGRVTGFSLLDSNTTIRFPLSGITAEGTWTASIPAGAFADAFGNPSLPFSASYTLDVGTVPY